MQDEELATLRRMLVRLRISPRLREDENWKREVRAVEATVEMLMIERDHERRKKQWHG